MAELAEEAQLEMAIQGQQVDKGEHYIIDISFLVADRRADYDSAVKHAQDAICKGVGISDSRIEAGNFRRLKTVEIPGMLILLENTESQAYEVF